MLYVWWARSLIITAVLVDQVHEVFGLPFGEGDQCHSQREGRGVPWSWEGAERVEELGVHDTEGQSGEDDYGHEGADL